MLQPKKTKFRRMQKGRMKGLAQRGNQLAYGSFAIKALESTWITGRQIEAARQAITRYMKREGQLWIRIFPDKPITKKPAEVRMGKGKGFQGVVKRHGFGGVGGQTHGQHNRQRKPGSLGASSYPSRVFPGKRLPGQMGGDQVKVLNLRVLKIIPESNLILVKGSIPGAKGAYLTIEK